MYSFFKKERLLLTLIILFGIFFGILGDEAFVGRCILFDVDAFGALRGLFDQILHRVSALGGLERFAEHLSEPAAKEVGDHVDQHRDP